MSFQWKTNLLRTRKQQKIKHDLIIKTDMTSHTEQKRIKKM